MTCPTEKREGAFGMARDYMPPLQVASPNLDASRQQRTTWVKARSVVTTGKRKQPQAGERSTVTSCPSLPGTDSILAPEVLSPEHPSVLGKPGSLVTLGGRRALEEAGAGGKCLRRLSVKYSVMPEAKSGDMSRRKISVCTRAGMMRPGSQ